MKIFKYIPLFILILIGYNFIVIKYNDITPQILDTVLFQFNLPSTDFIQFNVGHMLIILGMIFMCFEIFKATYTHTGALIEYIVSLLVFLAYIFEFLLLKNFGTTTFFLLGCISFVDVAGGFIIMVTEARRDIAVS